MEWKNSNRFLGRKTTTIHKYSGFFNDFFNFSGRELNLSLVRVKYDKRFLNSSKHELKAIIYTIFRGLRHLHS
jgi:hypothetical protein